MVTALSGLPADIRTAIASVVASGGLGDVIIPTAIGVTPDNKWHWNGDRFNVPAGVNIFGVGLAGCMDYKNNWIRIPASTMIFDDHIPTATNGVTSFTVDGSIQYVPTGRRTRISGLQIEYVAPANAAAEAWNTGEGSCAVGLINAPLNYRIDHCTFINAFGNAVSVGSDWNHLYPAYGLVDHCLLDLPYKETPEPTGQGWLAGYGVFCSGAMHTDNYVDDVTKFAAKYEAISAAPLAIVEDCHFSNYRHGLITYVGGVIQARHCLFQPPARYQMQDVSIGDVDQHGGGWGNNAAGELIEIYNSVFTGRPNFGTEAIALKGGHALIHHNVFHPPDLGNWKQCLVYLDSMGANDISQSYIWDNDVTNAPEILDATGYTEGVQYHHRAPTATELPASGFPGFSYIDAINTYGVPYPYPHPLIPRPSYNLQVKANPAILAYVNVDNAGRLLMPYAKTLDEGTHLIIVDSEVNI